MPGKKTGRRPKLGSRMPSTAITATAEDFIFLMLLGDGEVSGGIRRAVALLQKDEAGAALLRRAVRIRQRIEGILEADGQVASQLEIYRYITQHLELLGEEGAG